MCVGSGVWIGVGRPRPNVFLFLSFLVADTQLYKRLGPSVGLLVVIESKSGKTSVFDTFCVRLCVGVEVRCGRRLDAPAHPYATIM